MKVSIAGGHLILEALTKEELNLLDCLTQFSRDGEPAFVLEVVAFGNSQGGHIHLAPRQLYGPSPWAGSLSERLRIIGQEPSA